MYLYTDMFFLLFWLECYWIFSMQLQVRFFMFLRLVCPPTKLLFFLLQNCFHYYRYRLLSENYYYSIVFYERPS